MTIYQDAANNAKEAESGEIYERRLWTAVLLQALEDWKSPNLRLRSGAERFFFENREDFDRVCRGAGLEADRVFSRLRGMREAMPRPAVFRFERAA